MNATLEISKKQFTLKPFFLILFLTLLAGAFSAFYSQGAIWIHDEGSYLFQAKTFLLGRLTNPVHPEPIFFDQYHVINEGIYASKYFPGFAVTLMPFVALGIPYLNPIFFFALELMLIYLIGKEIFNPQTALLGTLLAGFSPQVFLQSAFLLNHIPGSVFLLITFLGFIQWRKFPSAAWALIAASAWAFAFLIRPITAVAFMIPIAICLIKDFFSKERTFSNLRFSAWIIPAVFGVFLYLAYNKGVTGSWLKTPFDLYADIFTPFHRYGFYTWDRYASMSHGSRVLKTFNEYYHNHTPADGILLAIMRLSIFTQFLMGSLPLGLLALGFWLFRLKQTGFYHRLIFWIWISIQCFHIPHWFPGILAYGCNYVYEVSGLVILAIADTLIDLKDREPFQKHGMDWIKGIALVWIFFSMTATMDAGYQMFKRKLPLIWIQKKVASEKIQKALVFVQYSADHNLEQDVVYNSPKLDSPIVFARDRGDEDRKLIPYFPGYTLLRWHYDEETIERI